MGSVPGLGRFPWQRKGQLISVFLPGKSMDRGTWWATVHGRSQRVGHDWVTVRPLHHDLPVLGGPTQHSLVSLSQTRLWSMWSNWLVYHHYGFSVSAEGCHAAAKSLHLCLTLCDPRDGSAPGSSIPGILQARTLEWVAISSSNA